MREGSVPKAWPWSQALATPNYFRALLAALAVGGMLAFALPHFFQWLGARPGMHLQDPLLATVGPHDVSLPTFLVLYGCLLVVLVRIAPSPVRVLHGLWAYILLMLLRMVAMTALVLEPPQAIIPLIDPLTQAFYPDGTPFLKDLFFSGHTATLVLLALLAPQGAVRVIAACCAVVVGMLVLVQHVHWTVDVLAAVPAAWLAWRGAGLLLRKWGALPSGAGA